MSESDRAQVVRSSAVRLADCCAWVVEAEASGHPQQLGTALCALYGHLVAQGWAPPPRAALLLRLRDGQLDVALEQLLAGPD